MNAYYGGIFGKAPETFWGAFATAELPRPLPFLEKLSAGSVFEYIKYRTDDPAADGREDALLLDLHGRYELYKFLNATAGFQTLRNRERSYDMRGYLEVGVSFG